MRRSEECQCIACREKRARKPREQWGLDARGEFRQPSTYYPQFAEERWQRRLERERQRKLQEEMTWTPEQD